MLLFIKNLINQTKTKNIVLINPHVKLRKINFSFDHLFEISVPSHHRPLHILKYMQELIITKIFDFKMKINV